MKKTLLAIALAAATTTAYADTSLSGHVNYMIGDLEEFSPNEDITVNGANTSMSRFRIKASKEAAGITYGTNIEVGLNAGSGTGGTYLTRVNEFYIKGGFGQLSLGQGSEVGDGKTEADFSGTYLGNGAAYNSWKLNALLRQVDGGRDQRLRYDSPKLGPVTLSFDYDDNEDFSGAIAAGGSFWKASAYFESRDDNDSDEVGASVAFKFSGVTLALQGGTVDSTGTTPVDDGYDFTKVILGYNSGAFSVAADYALDEDNGPLSVEVESLGLTFVYRPTKGVELYAGVRDAEVSATGLASADGDGFLLGGRVMF